MPGTPSPDPISTKLARIATLARYRPPLVLTSLALVRRAPGLGRGATALATAALVAWDTLVIEPVATRAGLWWWKDGGYFGVPVLGVLGWGIFAGAAALVLGRDALPRGVRLLWAPLPCAQPHFVAALSVPTDRTIPTFSSLAS